MKKRLSIATIFILLSLIISACGTITIQPNGADEVIPTEVHVQSEDINQPETASYKLPSMILVDTDDEYGLTFFNLQGQAITELKTPGIGYGSSGNVHIAGAVSGAPIMTPLVYRSFENPESLLVNINDSISKLVETSMFYGMSGAPGEGYIAYSVYEPTNESVHSDIYMGTLETLPTSGPVYSKDNSDDFYVANPVGVQTQAGIVTKIWFTHSAWGIGGDIIYPVNNSLYSIDMTTGDVIQHLDKTCSFQGQSQDFVWAACRTSDGNGSNGYFIQNLQNSSTVSFQVDPSSDRGAGYGVFSPDDLYVAWIEASGSHMAQVPDYQSRLRIGSTSGGIVYDQADTSIASALGIGSIPFMKPVGWLDTQTLLVEISADEYVDTALITINIATGAVNKIITGSFVAFAYP